MNLKLALWKSIVQPKRREMRHDQLLKIFKKHLETIDPDTQGIQDLVYDVVGDYMAYLMKKGHIPCHMQDTLETDLREEVLEIYRKVTYGHLNLKSYKSSQQNKLKLPRSS
jgi:hypothetical protein